MVIKSELTAMSNYNITEINKKKLVDIRTVCIDTSQPVQERLESYINDIKNPYFFLCGKTPVKLEFTGQGKSLEEKIVDYFIELKNR